MLNLLHCPFWGSEDLRTSKLPKIRNKMEWIDIKEKGCDTLPKQNHDRHMLIPDKKAIAKKAYAKIVKAITDLEEKENIYCDLPNFIDIDGTRFYKSELSPNR